MGEQEATQADGHRPAPPALSQKIAVMQKNLDAEIRAYDVECQSAIESQVGSHVLRHCCHGHVLKYDTILRRRT